ncbi:MAG TPA: hypothetical protein VF101_19115 [Gaiellaceae bacterium]
MAERLDEQKVATLRLWADGLARDERDEMRAAARAILLLIEEIELLHVELWHAGRLRGVEEAAEDDAAEAVADDGVRPPERQTLRAVLRERLRLSAQKASAPTQTDSSE